MTTLPAAGHISNSARTTAEVQQDLEDTIQFLRERLGGDAEDALTIASGSITPTAAINSVDTEGAASTDDLANIDASNLGDGSLLLIRCTSAARVITVKHNAGGSGQIALVGSADMKLNATTVWLLLLSSGGNWVEITRFGALVEPKKGASVASASTCDIWTPADGELLHITGTTGITSFGTAPQAGAIRTLIFDGALTLTHNATTLKLPGGANITTAAGDRAIVRADTTANMIVVAYVKADGTPIALPDGGVTAAKESDDDWESVASAGTVDLGATTSRNVLITGTTTITSFGNTGGQGRVRRGRFAGALTLTHDATALILPGGANITTAAGDTFVAVKDSDASGYWRVVGYQKASGAAIVSSGGQVWGYDQYTTNAGLTATIPYDDTIPQSTEGTQILSVTVNVPSSTAEVIVYAQGTTSRTSGTSTVVAALFDGASNAIAANINYVDNQNAPSNWQICHRYVPGAAGSKTFTVRTGPDTGTAYLNGLPSGRLLGGVSKATLLVIAKEP